MKGKPTITSGVATVSPGVHTASGRPETRLRLPTGKPDLESLGSVTREWLVPRLVDKFLRMHGIESTRSPEHLLVVPRRL